MSWPIEDDISARFAVVQLSELGVGSYEEIAKAFKVHERSVYNYIHSFSQEGAYGLIPDKRGPKGSWKLNARLRSAILFLVMNRGIFEYEEIQKQLEGWGESISIPSIRQVLLESGIVEGMGLADPNVEQVKLFEVEDKGQRHLDFGIGSELSKESEAEGNPNREEKTEAARELPCSRVVMKRERSLYSRAQRVYFRPQ